MGFTPPQVRSHRVRRSLYLRLRMLGQKIESTLNFFIKKLNREEKHNHHITIGNSINDKHLQTFMRCTSQQKQLNRKCHKLLGRT